MEPMNAFLAQHRENFKEFIDEVCTPPAPLADTSFPASARHSTPTYPPEVVSADTHLSYTTPMTIMQRLPPTSREGFPSLPYLIDQGRAFADLVALWVEALGDTADGGSGGEGARSREEMVAAVRESGGDLVAFHDICVRLHRRTRECLNRAERAEQPHSSVVFQWEDAIAQIQKMPVSAVGGGGAGGDGNGFERGFEGIAGDPSAVIPPGAETRPDCRGGWDAPTSEATMPVDGPTRPLDPGAMGPRHSSPAVGRPRHSIPTTAPSDVGPTRDRPSSSAGRLHTLRETLRRPYYHSSTASQAPASPSHSMTASVSASTSAVSSDTEGVVLPPAGEAPSEDLTPAAPAPGMERPPQQPPQPQRRGKTPKMVVALRKKKERESAAGAGFDPCSTGRRGGGVSG